MLLGLLGGVVPLCPLYYWCVVFCVVVRASSSIHSFSHLSFFPLSCSSSLVARFAGGDLHYHGAGLSAGRGNDVNVSGIIDVERFANGILVYCDCNLELELELIQTQMAQKPMLRAEVGMRVRCANKASAE